MMLPKFRIVFSQKSGWSNNFCSVLLVMDCDKKMPASIQCNCAVFRPWLTPYRVWVKMKACTSSSFRWRCTSQTSSSSRTRRATCSCSSRAASPTCCECMRRRHRTRIRNRYWTFQHPRHVTRSIYRWRYTLKTSSSSRTCAVKA